MRSFFIPKKIWQTCNIYVLLEEIHKGEQGHTWQTFSYLKSTIEAPERDMNYVQSLQ